MNWPEPPKNHQSASTQVSQKSTLRLGGNECWPETCTSSDRARPRLCLRHHTVIPWGQSRMKCDSQSSVTRELLPSTWEVSFHLFTFCTSTISVLVSPSANISLIRRWRDSSLNAHKSSVQNWEKTWVKNSKSWHQSLWDCVSLRGDVVHSEGSSR